MSHLDVQSLTTFKQQDTDENRIIARLLSEMIPQFGEGWILDVGAGMGDLAAVAFPYRKALLMDRMAFPVSENPNHQNLQADFLICPPPPDKDIDLILLSHAVQYLDDDVELLNAAIRAWRAKEIIVVRDIIDADQRFFLNELAAMNVKTNAEEFLPDFPHGYTKQQELFFQGTIIVKDFTLLAHRLGTIIFDAGMAENEIIAFSKILKARLPEPRITIPQTIERFILNK